MIYNLITNILEGGTEIENLLPDGRNDVRTDVRTYGHTEVHIEVVPT